MMLADGRDSDGAKAATDSDTTQLVRIRKRSIERTSNPDILQFVRHHSLSAPTKTRNSGQASFNMSKTVLGEL